MTFFQNKSYSFGGSFCFEILKNKVKTMTKPYFMHKKTPNKPHHHATC